MPDGDGTGFIETDTLEVRAETLTIRCAGTAQRRGDSDRLEIGDTTALDVVAGEESLHAKRGLTERIGGSASTRASRLKTTVNGRLKVSGRAETTLLGGAMADTQAGAVLVAAGMSDDLVVGGGARATVPVDIWLAGLIGMEEKVGTAAADGVLMERYRTLFEREYGSGTHVAGVAVFSGALHVTVKAGFRPMMKALRGIRNLTPGGGGGGGSAPPPTTPPPAPPGEAATGLLGTFRGVSDVEDAGDLPRLSDSFTHAEDLANATETASAREAPTAAWLENLQVLRRAAEQDDTEEAEAILRRLRGDNAAWQRPTYVDFNARYYLSMDADGRYMLLEDPGGPYRLAEGPDGSRRVVQDPEAEFTASKDLRRYDIELGPDGRYRLIDPNASDSDPTHWLHSVGFGEQAEDPGSSRIAGDAPQRLDDPAGPGHALPFAGDGPGDSRAGNPPGTHPSVCAADPDHARTLDLHPEPAPLDAPGAGDSRAGPIATIETVGQRSYAVPAEGGDLTRHPIGPSSGADEASQGRIYATVIQDPTTNQGVTTPLMVPADDDSPRVLLDIEIEQIDLEHVDDARDPPSPGRLSDSAGEGTGPGMQLGDRGPRWEEPDLPPARPDAPHDTPGHNDYSSADILHALPEDSPNQSSEPPAVSHFYGDDEALAAPPPAATPPGQGAGRLSARTDTTGAIQRLGQEIALQTEEIRRVRDGGGSADDLRRLEAEREARRLALSEMQAGRDPRPALRTQAAEAQEPYRTEAFTDLFDYFGGSGQFSPQGTSPRTGGLHSRIPSALDTSELIAGWREQVGALSEAADVLNPRTAAEIEHAEALSDTESWTRHAIVMIANRQDPSSELLRHAADLEARTFADGTTGAGEASTLRAMAKEYQDLLEEFLAGYPVFPLQLDEVETLPGGSPRSLDVDAGIGRPGQDVPVEDAGIRSAGDPEAGAVELPPLEVDPVAGPGPWGTPELQTTRATGDPRDLRFARRWIDAVIAFDTALGSADQDAALEDARQNLRGDIYDAFGASSPKRDTPVADPGSDPGRHPTREDYWGMRQGLSPPAPGSSDDVADTATDPVRVPSQGERGESTSDSHPVLDGMEAAFDDTAGAPPSSSPPPSSERYRIAAEHLDEVLDTGEDTRGATAAPTPRTKDRKVRWGDATTVSFDVGETSAAVESRQPSRNRIDFMEKHRPKRDGDVRTRLAMELACGRELHELGGGATNPLVHDRVSNAFFDVPPSARQDFSGLMGMRCDFASRDELARYLSETREFDGMADTEAWREYHRLYPAEAEELWESMWYSKRQGNIRKGRPPDRGVPATPWPEGEQGP